MSIRVLDPRVVQQVAAGEVVDRPASVVKELVENALDAEASHFEVELGDGGTSRILVRDDGSVMSPEDAALSVLRHATSKIRAVKDLETDLYPRRPGRRGRLQGCPLGRPRDRTGLRPRGPHPRHHRLPIRGPARRQALPRRDGGAYKGLADEPLPRHLPAWPLHLLPHRHRQDRPQTRSALVRPSPHGWVRISKPNA